MIYILYYYNARRGNNAKKIQKTYFKLNNIMMTVRYLFIRTFGTPISAHKITNIGIYTMCKMRIKRKIKKT